MAVPAVHFTTEAGTFTPKKQSSRSSSPELKSMKSFKSFSRLGLQLRAAEGLSLDSFNAVGEPSPSAKLSPSFRRLSSTQRSSKMLASAGEGGRRRATSV